MSLRQQRIVNGTGIYFYSLFRKSSDEFPEIDICGGWMTVFGKGIAPTVKQTLAGYIKEPLVEML